MKGRPLGRRLATAVSRVVFGRQLYTETSAKAVTGSIFIRHVDGGSSNIAESELTALTNPLYDISQYGISFVSAPSHADLMLLTGPVTRNMLGAVTAAFDMMPPPQTIITVGDHAEAREQGEAPDAESGATATSTLFRSSYATVDLPERMRAAIADHVPGDPPEPTAILNALLGEIERRRNSK